MVRFPVFLRSMLHLAARESGRFRVNGVRVVSANGVTLYEATDGRRIARATIPTPDAPPCDVILPAARVASLLGKPLVAGTCEDEFGNELACDDDSLDGGVEFTIPAAPGGISTLSTCVETLGPTRAGSDSWPNTDRPSIFPRGEAQASILVNAVYVREMLRAAEDASKPNMGPAHMWLSIYEVELPPDATHKKARREKRLVIQTRDSREKGATYASVLMPVDHGTDPRPPMPLDDSPATPAKE